MSRFGTQYQVSRSTGVCAATGRAFAPGSVCIACLCERPDDDGFDRLDYSPEAWASEARPPRLFSFWKTTVSRPDDRQRLLVDDEVLMDLFQRLADDERPQRVAFRFVLALILMRKRLLKFVGRKGGSGDEREWWLMRPKGVGPDQPPLEVFNPRLADDDVRELTAQLSEVLRGEF